MPPARSTYAGAPNRSGKSCRGWVRRTRSPGERACMTSAPPRLASERYTLSAMRVPSDVASTTEYDRSSRAPRTVISTSTWAPGWTGTGCSGASTIRRMRLVNATDSMTVACCQTAVCDAAISGRRWGRLQGTRRRRPDEDHGRRRQGGRPHPDLLPRGRVRGCAAPTCRRHRC